MPAPYTPTPQIGATDPPFPEGDPKNAALAREQLNNRRYLRGAAWGLLTWSGTLAVSGSAAAPVVVVGILDALALRPSGGVWRPYFTDAETTLGASHVEGGGSLSANTWYYVYAYVQDGDTAARFQISATPPTEAGTPSVRKQYKRGESANYRYLGCFPTDSSGDPIPVQARSGRYTFHIRASTSASGTDTPGGSSMTTSLAAFVPPHARTAELLLQPATAAVSLTETGWGGSFGIGSSGFVTMPYVLNTSRQVEWTGAAGAVLTVFVRGFQE